MIRLRVKWTADLRRHRALRQAIKAGTGPVKDALGALEPIYRAFVVKRFDKFSKGGGDWKRLSPQTEQRKGSRLILVATRLLRERLARMVRIQTQSRNSIKIQFVSSARHPDTTLTMSELANVHDQGLGVPRRKILVLPDFETRKEMRISMSKDLAKALRD